MSAGSAFPIRWKILVSLLLVVTAAVSVITFTMANLFHEDKTAYIRDLTSLVVQSAAEETNSILAGYGERVEMYGRILGDRDMPAREKDQLLRGLFEDFPDLLAVVLYRNGQVEASALDSRSFVAAGIAVEEVARQIEGQPVPFDRVAAGEPWVRNLSLGPELPSVLFAVDAVADDTPVIAVALLRLDKLVALSSRFTVFDVAVTDADGVLLAHRDAAAVASRSRRSAGADAGPAELAAGTIHEVRRDGVALLAGAASVDFGGAVAIAEIPKSAAYLASRSLLSRLLFVAVALLMSVAVISLFWARGLTRHVERLSEATREIAQGRFDVQVAVDTRDEIGALARSFNQMGAELQQREQKLGEAHAQLVQSEKLAAFGQLGAGIAHEVKNPLAGIRGCAQLALRKVEPGGPVEKNLKLIEKETKRCEAIVQNLLKFARQEKAVLEPVHLAAVVDDAAAIVRHHLELAGAKLEIDVDPTLPEIRGHANQLQQVLINLMVNAQQAFDGQPGTIRVVARRLDEALAEIRVIDDGPGMPKEVQAKIFEPFFTTKTAGRGTGLGLSVSFGIIEEHGGKIRVESAPGAGTTMVIHLPLDLSEAPRPGTAVAATPEPALA